MPRSILVVDPEADFYRERLLAAFPQLEVKTALSTTEAMPHAPDVDAFAGMPRFFNDAMVRDARRLRWIQVFTTGVDHVIGLASLKAETIVTSLRGIHGPQMAEMAVMHMLALARDLPRMVRNQQHELWDRFLQRRLYGKTVVILGVGISGEELAPRCKALGMTVVGVSSSPRAVPGFDRIVPRAELIAAAREADFLAVLVPYDKSTDKIVNEALLCAMKPSAYLVNIARGGVCDEQALIDALEQKRIAGAALDVFKTEPLPASSPLWRMPNVIVTPHEAGQCDVYNDLVFALFQKNVQCFLEDRVSDMVNRVAH
jgi:phosphoglycerate dehydrogenase-like enzyme